MTGKCERRGVDAPLRWLFHARLMAVVSVIYVWSYFLTVSVVAPVQSMVLPATAMSVVFLPHGVRVLAAWMYGWRSVGYLLPGAMLCNLHFAGDRAFDPVILSGTLASLVSAPLAFAAVRRFWGRRGGRIATAPGETRLQTVLLVGAAASVLNLTGLQLAYGLAPAEGAVILVGDVTGLALSMLVVWATLRLLKGHI